MFLFHPRSATPFCIYLHFSKILWKLTTLNIKLRYHLGIRSPISPCTKIQKGCCCGRSTPTHEVLLFSTHQNILFPSQHQTFAQTLLPSHSSIRPNIYLHYGTAYTLLHSEYYKKQEKWIHHLQIICDAWNYLLFQHIDRASWKSFSQINPIFYQSSWDFIEDWWVFFMFIHGETSLMND